MRRRRCHRCPPFESSFPQEIWYLLCRLCHQKDLLVDGDFLHRFPVFLSLKVGVNCWAEPPEMRRGCFSAKALPSNPLNVLAATSGTSWDSICWILWFVGPGQNVQIPNQQPIGIDQHCWWWLSVLPSPPSPSALCGRGAAWCGWTRARASPAAWRFSWRKNCKTRNRGSPS